MRRKFDLIVVDREQRVQLVAESGLSRSRAEQRLALYDQTAPSEQHTVAIARAGKYYPGETFEELWHDEEE